MRDILNFNSIATTHQSHYRPPYGSIYRRADGDSQKLKAVLTAKASATKDNFRSLIYYLTEYKFIPITYVVGSNPGIIPDYPVMMLKRDGISVVKQIGGIQQPDPNYPGIEYLSKMPGGTYNYAVSTGTQVSPAFYVKNGAYYPFYSLISEAATIAWIQFTQVYIEYTKDQEAILVSIISQCNFTKEMAFLQEAKNKLEGIIGEIAGYNSQISGSINVSLIEGIVVKFKAINEYLSGFFVVYSGTETELQPTVNDLQTKVASGLSTCDLLLQKIAQAQRSELLQNAQGYFSEINSHIIGYQDILKSTNNVNDIDKVVTGLNGENVELLQFFLKYPNLEKELSANVDSLKNNIKSLIDLAGQIRPSLVAIPVAAPVISQPVITSPEIIKPVEPVVPVLETKIKAEPLIDNIAMDRYGLDKPLETVVSQEPVADAQIGATVLTEADKSLDNLQAGVPIQSTVQTSTTQPQPSKIVSTSITQKETDIVEKYKLKYVIPILAIGIVIYLSQKKNKK